MKKQLIALSLLALPFFAVAKGTGYGNTDWGMTPSEVVAVQKGAHLITPEKFKHAWGKVQTDNLTIGSGIYTIKYLFDGSDRLIQTNVSNNEKKNKGIINLHFDALHKMLTQKYGKPAFEGDDSVVWKVEDTSIELTRLIIANIMANVTVIYRPDTAISKDTSNL